MPQIDNDLWVLHFPKAGIDRSRGFAFQPSRQVAGEEYARTTPIGVNVRAYEQAGNRRRGGSRCGLSKYLTTRPGDIKWITQHLGVMVSTGTTGPGGQAVQLSNSGRVVSLVAVARGNVYSTVPEGTAWTAATNATGETPPLNSSGLIRSAANNQRLYFVDGTNYRYWNPNTNTVNTWTTTAGSLPIDSQNNKAQLICTWRGRTVLSGLLRDPHNWFMSRISDPHDFLYQSGANDSAQAIAGNNAPMGLIGDVVNTLIPYSDDVLIFGCDSSVWTMRGDPYSGGQLDLVSPSTGMAWGRPHCTDDAGVLYFFGNRGGVYAMDPRGGMKPVRISQSIEQLSSDVNTGTHNIIMEWDDTFQELHVWITKLASAAPATHYAWEKRTNAWWQDVYQNKNHNPLVSCVIDGNRPGDRAVLIGSWDGYVRKIDPAAVTDDGYDIESEVLIGPLTTKNYDEIVTDELQPVMGEDSGDVAAELLLGKSAESALAAEPVEVGTFEAGRNTVFPIRAAGHAIYCRLTASVPWAMEQFRFRVQPTGAVRRRA